MKEQKEIDNAIAEYLKMMFGEMVVPVLELQKRKICPSGELELENYYILAENLKILCTNMAGKLLGERVYEGVIQIIKKYQKN